MKKYLGLLLICLLLVLGCAAAEEEVPPLCGAVLVSESMGGDWSLLEERRHLDAVLTGLSEDWYDIAMDVPDERVVDIRGGQELYLILPLDADATVSVVHLSEDEETLIYESETGEPFLLRCNAAPSPWEEDPYLSDFEEVSEPFDCRVVIADSMDHVLIWNPYVHFNRGEVNTDAQGGCVIDFTNYESVPCITTYPISRKPPGGIRAVFFFGCGKQGSSPAAARRRHRGRSVIQMEGRIRRLSERGD